MAIRIRELREKLIERELSLVQLEHSCVEKGAVVGELMRAVEKGNGEGEVLRQKVCTTFVRGEGMCDWYVVYGEALQCCVLSVVV